MMTLGQIGKLGKELTRFHALFVGCFRSQPGFASGRVYVQGLLSNLGRKNAEAIAMECDTPPRTLQRLLESLKWDEKVVRDKCQQLWHAITTTPKPSAASMNRERPSAATKP